MSGTNETLNPRPAPSVADWAVKDLTPFSEAELCELKRSIVLQQCNVENEIVRLEEAQIVRLAEFDLQWDAYEEMVSKKIAEQEQRLERMKDIQKQRKAERKNDLRLLKAEHKEANSVLVNEENFLKSSLQAIAGAIKALATMQTRKELNQVQFVRDTWTDLED